MAESGELGTQVPAVATAHPPVAIDADAAPAEPLVLTPELQVLLDERLAAADADPDGGIPWEVVRARLWAGR